MQIVTLFSIQVIDSTGKIYAYYNWDIRPSYII